MVPARSVPRKVGHAGLDVWAVGRLGWGAKGDHVPHTIWMFPELLERHGVTPHRLARETTRLGRNAIYRLADAEHPPARVELATIAVLVDALRRVTGDATIDVDDLLVVAP